MIKRKEKKSVIAVDHISLIIEKGSIVGLLGPNGAGKSTLIKMILGVLYPTSGEVEICGMNSYKHRTKLMKSIGIVFGQRSQLWWDLPSMDSFELIRKMYDVSKEKFHATVNEMVELLEAQEIVKTPVRYLSLGQRMKCEIIAALCFQPDIIILDEPTIGLDIAAKESIRQFLKQVNQERKVTILLATHDLADVEAICNRVIVVNQGKVLFDDTDEKIREKQSEKRQAEIIFMPYQDDIELPGECIRSEIGGKQIIKLVGSSQQITEVVNWCFRNGRVEDVNITRQSIEKVIMDLYNL